MYSINEKLYKELGLDVLNYKESPESKEYQACSFNLNDKRIIGRQAKITPKKIGQFVAIWKRSDLGITQPYDVTDDFDFFVVHVANETNSGQFIFSKDILCKYGLIANKGVGGKRGVRLYPPWDIALNKTALATQKWQLNYFLESQNHHNIDITRAKKLYEVLNENEKDRYYQ